jgi:NADPH:quinone reductase-like Zn-dependent oxidoreductase
MRAIVTIRHGGPEVLAFHTDWPAPRPGPGEVLIRVGACGMNNTDVNTRLGWYAEGADDDEGWGGGAVQFPRIQGADVCGRIVEPAARAGERVLVDPWVREPLGYVGSERDGGFAEYVVVPAANAVTIESDLTDAELATFPTSSNTALNMLRRAGATAGERILVTGASGGVGTALIQVARSLGAIPIAVAAQAKAEAVRSIGAEEVVGRDECDLGALGPFDVVADVVGGSGFPGLLDALRPGGRYVCSGAIAGPLVDLDLRTLYLRDLTLFGATVPPVGAFHDLVALIERGVVRPLLAATYPLERFVEGQEAFMAKRHVGNIVVAVT